MPSAAKIVLQDRMNATSRVTVVPSAHTSRSWFRMVAVDPGNGSAAGSSNVDEGPTTPFSNPAAAVTTLNVEPGG